MFLNKTVSRRVFSCTVVFRSLNINANKMKTNPPKIAIKTRELCQGKYLAVKPPIIGAITAAMAATDMISDITLPSLSLSKWSRATAADNTRPPDRATPWKKRKNIRVSAFGERAAEVAEIV